MQAPLAHYNMPGLNQNPFQYQQRKFKHSLFEYRKNVFL
jgi:hypothetical protein